MPKITRVWILPLVIVVVGIAGVVLIILNAGKSVKLDSFAQCLEKEGAVFYGAFWCPHCQDQKALFGKSKKNLPYVECSTPDGRGQVSLCAEKKIPSYPTWTFADNSVNVGLMSLEDLAEKTACELPRDL